MYPQITLYNTLSRTKEIFIPLEEGKVKIYSCGPTVYHYAHLGNLRGYVLTDVLRRLFVYAHYDTAIVINITDVGHNVDDSEDGEDKMEKGSRREGKSAWDIAAMYTEAYFKDLERLNIPLSVYSFPRATDTIPEQIEMVRMLEEKGYTYTISDGVYFDTSKFAHYADLAKLDIEGLKSGARVEENKEKRNITDFVLWKFSPKDQKRQMEWDSPWGIGCPGWHIECSAMSKKLLGPHLDIHLGGIDHIPVHHTNEIAQSECANGEKYVNYWVHYNFLNDPTGKMAKSKGDFLRLQSVIDKGISPLAYRYYLLTAHYRKEIEFSFEALEAAASAYEKLVKWCSLNFHLKGRGQVIDFFKKRFDEAIFDDLATPTCVSLVWGMLNEVRTSFEKEDWSIENRYATLLSFDEVLGLGLKDIQPQILEITQEVQALIDERKNAREEKDWAKADALREQIKSYGFDVKDTGDGQELIKL